MSRSFINVVWGIYKGDDGYIDNHWHWRLAKVDNDVELHLLNPYAQPTHVFIFGEDNYKIMTDLGFNCTMLDKRPFVYDMVKEQYGHKLLAWKIALEMFNEIVFTDFDCIPLKPLPVDFWQVLGKGDSWRSSIYMYRLKRIFSRKLPSGRKDQRKTSGANWVYIRGKEEGAKLLKWWEDHGKPWKEEISLSEYIDSTHGGWQGFDFYRDTHEPLYQNNYDCWDQDWVEKNLVPNICFAHINKNTTLKLLGTDDNVKDRIDNCYKYYVDMMKSNKVKHFTIRW